MANAAELKKDAEQYLTGMKAKYQADTREWERFAGEVPGKFKQLVASGLKHSVSRGPSSGGSLSVSLSFEANMDAAKAYLEKLMDEIPERGKKFVRVIDDFDAKLQQYFDGGLDADTFEKLVRHFAQWVDFANALKVPIHDREITVELPAKYPARKKHWLEMADRQNLEEYAARYGISVADVPKHKKYLEGKQKKASAKTSAAMNQAVRLLQGVDGYLDAHELLLEAKKTAEEMRRREEEQERIRKAEEERRKQEETARKEAERKEKCYQDALRDLRGNDEETVAKAMAALKGLKDYRDAKTHVAACESKLALIREQKEKARREAERKAAEERRRREEEERRKRLEEEERQRRLEEEERRRREEEEARIRAKKARRKRRLILLLCLALVALAAYLAVTLYVIPKGHYEDAQALLAQGKKKEAAMLFGSVSGYADARERSFALWDEFANRDVLAAGGSNHVGKSFFGGIDENGNPLIFANDREISVPDGNYIAVAAGEYGLYYLRDDGTVYGKPEWKDIVDIASGGDGSLFGLRADGTVAVSLSHDYRNDGYPDRFEDWTNIVDLAAGFDYLVGLKADGTVITEGFRKSCDNYNGELNVGGWTDIVKIEAGSNVTLGMKADGTVVAVGSDYYGTVGGTAEWTDIVDISGFRGPVSGLRADGTVVISGASGDHNHGEGEAIQWTDIVMVESGNFYVLGVQADGTILVAGALRGEPKPWPSLKGLNP